MNATEQPLQRTRFEEKKTPPVSIPFSMHMRKIYEKWYNSSELQHPTPKIDSP